MGGFGLEKVIGVVNEVKKSIFCGLGRLGRCHILSFRWSVPEKVTKEVVSARDVGKGVGVPCTGLGVAFLKDKFYFE